MNEYGMSGVSTSPNNSSKWSSMMTNPVVNMQQRFQVGLGTRMSVLMHEYGFVRRQLLSMKWDTM